MKCEFVSPSLIHRFAEMTHGIGVIERRIRPWAPFLLVLFASAYYGSFALSGLDLAGEGGTMREAQESASGREESCERSGAVGWTLSELWSRLWTEVSHSPTRASDSTVRLRAPVLLEAGDAGRPS